MHCPRAQKQVRGLALCLRPAFDATAAEQPLHILRREEVAGFADQALHCGSHASTQRSWIDLGDKDGATGTHDSRHLARRFIPTDEVMEGVAHDHRVERPIRKGHRRRVALHGEHSDPTVGVAQHLRARIEDRHQTAHLRGEQAGQLAGAAAEVEDAPSRGHEPLQQARHSSCVVVAPTPRRPCEERRCPSKDLSRHGPPWRLAARVDGGGPALYPLTPGA